MSAPIAQLLQCCDFCHKYSVIGDSLPLIKVTLQLKIPGNPTIRNLRDAGTTTLDICSDCAMRLNNLLKTELTVYQLDEYGNEIAVKWKAKEDQNE